MTEVEWLTGTDPTSMLEFLQGKASDRKLRLFACACCRRIWRYLSDPRSKEAIERAEEFADGILTAVELQVMWDAAWEATHHLHDAAFHASRAAAWATQASAGFASSESADAAIAATVCDPYDPEEDHLYQASSLGCIFSNPFRPITLDPSWLTSTVLTLAQGIYAERAFDRLPILADALQDAGCENPDVLDHCRGPGPHVRGCWVVDMLTNRD